MTAQTKHFSTIAGSKIDREKGIIFGVCVVTEGVAKGHGLLIDSKTLSTVKEVADEFSSGVKVKLRHREEGEHQSVIEATAGTLRNFSIKGKKLIADFHLLNSFSAHLKEKIFEMAEVMPDQFGFSMHFSGKSEEKDGDKFARCEELQSVDLSDNPAANPTGLFSTMKSIKYETGKSGKHASDCDCGECPSEKAMSTAPTNAELADSISKLTATVTGLVTKLSVAPEVKPIASLTYKDATGKEVTLSGEEIATQLSAAAQVAADGKKVAEDTLRANLLSQMDAQGRVPMNPATSKAYTLSELNALPIQTLQFAAINSPTIPLQAKAIYRGTEKPKLDSSLKGSDRIFAALDEKYGNLDVLLATPMGMSPN